MPAREDSVFKSPWFWGVGGCCLGCVGIPLALLAIFGAGVFGVFGAMSQSDVIDLAIERAQTDPRVAETLGRPLQRSFMFQGSIQIENDRGSADVMVPVTGPLAKGELWVVGSREGGEWRLERLEVVVVATGERILIDLRALPPATAPATPLEAPDPPPPDGDPVI